jgi:HlyD family secretion protein
VTRIDPESTFTPENTYFKDDRVKQVVGVKLQLKGATGFAKPGMPADGEILTEGTVWPDRNKRQAKQ